MSNPSHTRCIAPGGDRFVFADDAAVAVEARPRMPPSKVGWPLPPLPRPAQRADPNWRSPLSRRRRFPESKNKNKKLFGAIH